MLIIRCCSGWIKSDACCNVSEVNCLASLLFQRSAPMITKRINFMWIVIRLDLERGLESDLIISCEVVTRDEIFSFVYILSVDLTNELSYIPEEILLENSFTSKTEILTKCIQSRFCCVWFPTTVENCHISICHCCDQITVKINIWNGVICDHFGVTRLPVLVWLNCLTHLGFDLSHGVSVVWITMMGQFRGE